MDLARPLRNNSDENQEHKPPRAPAAGILRPLSAASGSSGNLQKDWDGWAVDVRLELANLVFPTGLSGDASIVRLLETDANSVCFCETASSRTGQSVVLSEILP